MVSVKLCERWLASLESSSHHHLFSATQVGIGPRLKNGRGSGFCFWLLLIPCYTLRNVNR